MQCVEQGWFKNQIVGKTLPPLSLISCISRLGVNTFFLSRLMTPSLGTAAVPPVSWNTEHMVWIRWGIWFARKSYPWKTNYTWHISLVVMENPFLCHILMSNLSSQALDGWKLNFLCLKKRVFVFFVFARVWQAILLPRVLVKPSVNHGEHHWVTGYMQSAFSWCFVVWVSFILPLSVHCFF